MSKTKDMGKAEKKAILKEIISGKAKKGASPFKLGSDLGKRPLKTSDIGGGAGSNLGITSKGTKGAF